MKKTKVKSIQNKNNVYKSNKIGVRIGGLLHLTLKCLEIRHKNSLIILKRHPRPYRNREENKILERILSEFSHLNIKFDSSPNFILSLHSKCNLIMNNGSIFTAHAMNKNSYFSIMLEGLDTT